MSLLGKTKPRRLHRETILSMSGVGRATVPPQKKDLLTTSRAGRSCPGVMVSDAMNSVNEGDGGHEREAFGVRHVSAALSAPIQECGRVSAIRGPIAGWAAP